MSGGATDKTISASDVLPPAASGEDLPPGTTVGEYVLEHKLGEGGFGTVYRATHPVIGKAAAVKVLHRAFSANGEVVARFIAEARAVNQIRHRNIVDIFSFGALPDGRHYYVMELLEGVSLDEHLSKVRRMDLASALPILKGVAKALDAAHAQGIVHRDLKPENVFLVTHDDGTFFPKLVDFGIAKLVGTPEAGPSSTPQAKTRTGTLIGTPYYMSPEQCRGIGVDHRTDIYAFGVMVHRMLSGALPFDGQSAMDVMMGHVSAEPPKVSTLVASLPAGVDEIVARLLAKTPAARPQTVSAAVEELEAVAHLAPAPRSHSPTANTGDQLAPVPAPPAQAITDLGMSGEHRRQGGRSLLIGIGAVAVVSAVLLGVALTRRAHSDAQTEGTRAPVPQTSKVTTSGPAASAPQTTTTTVASAPVPVPTPEPAASVAVRIDTTPAAAEVWLGEQKLGASPGPFRLPRGEPSTTLRVSAPGFEPKTVQVATKGDGSYSVTLAPAASGKPGNGKTGKPISGDLENPFGN